MSRRVRRRRTAGSVDRWKNKVWADIRAPVYIDDKSLGRTPANDIEGVIGRSIKITLMDLTNNYKDLNYHLTFKVSAVDGHLARTEFHEYELSRDFKRAQIRNHRSKIEGIFNLRLNDGAKVRMTTFVVTPKRAAQSVKKQMRQDMHVFLEEKLAGMSFPAFVDELLNGTIKSELYPVAEDNFSIKILDVAKVKVIRLPTGSIPEEITTEEVITEEVITEETEPEEENLVEV